VSSCTFLGCNVSGILTKNRYDYYYVATGGQGLQYIFRAFGNDVKLMHLVSTSNGKLPKYPGDDNSIPISDTALEVLDFSGSCQPTVLFLGVTTALSNVTVPYNLLIKAYISEGPASSTCTGLLHPDYLLCVMIGVGGAVAWVILSFVWFIYSCKNRGRAAFEDQQRLLGY